MNVKSILLLAVAVLAGPSSLLATEAVKGFETQNIVLYQTDDVLHARIPSVEELGGYMKRLQGVCTTFFADADKPETLHVVVVLKPGKRSRVWFVSSTRPSGDKERESLRRKLEAVTPVDVRQGPVAFAISAKIAGGDGKSPGTGAGYQPPIPAEWRDAAKSAKKEAVSIEEFLNLVWPGDQ